MDFSRQINYQSDFDVVLNITDSEGTAVGFPTFDFQVIFSTVNNVKYEAGQKGSVVRNIVDSNGNARVVLNRHKLSPGVLKMKFIADVDNVIYPDGKKLTVFPVETGITLVTGAGDNEGTDLTIDVTLPFVAPASSSSSSSTSSSSSQG